MEASSARSSTATSARATRSVRSSASKQSKKLCTRMIETQRPSIPVEQVYQTSLASLVSRPSKRSWLAYDMTVLPNVSSKLQDCRKCLGIKRRKSGRGVLSGLHISQIKAAIGDSQKEADCGKLSVCTAARDMAPTTAAHASANIWTWTTLPGQQSGLTGVQARGPG